MIAELSAAMAAIKETAGLVKIINEANTQAEVNAAMGELNSKLASIQRECVSLVELVGSYQEMNASLKAKIAEFEDFKSDSEGYVLNQVESGAFVYTKKIVMNDTEVSVHACPNCLAKKAISILQPTGEASYDAHTSQYFHKSKCHSCSSSFSLNKSDYDPGSWST